MTKEKAVVIREASALMKQLKAGTEQPHSETAQRRISFLVHAQIYGLIEPELFFEICERLIELGV